MSLLDHVSRSCSLLLIDSLCCHTIFLCSHSSSAGKKSEEETEQNLATAGKDAKTLVNKASDAIKNIGKDAQDQIDTTAQNSNKQ
jgi:hypothetical protein